MSINRLSIPYNITFSNGFYKINYDTILDTTNIPYGDADIRLSPPFYFLFNNTMLDYRKCYSPQFLSLQEVPAKIAALYMDENGISIVRTKHGLQHPICFIRVDKTMTTMWGFRIKLIGGNTKGFTVAEYFVVKNFSKDTATLYPLSNFATLPNDFQVPVLLIQPEQITVYHHQNPSWQEVTSWRLTIDFNDLSMNAPSNRPVFIVPSE